MAERPTCEELENRIQELEQELSERERIEEALRESQARFQLLYERAPLGYQSLDEDGNFIEVNPAWLNILGYSREEVIGKSFSEFLHPDWRDHFKEYFPRFKALGEVLGVEFEIVKKDGSSLLVSFNGNIGRDKYGCFQQTHCVFQDITERKKAEEALRESESRFRSLFDLSPQAIALAEVDTGKLVDINDRFCELTQYSMDELIGRTPIELGFFREEDRSGFLNLLKESGEIHGLEMNINIKDGSTLHALVFSKIIKISEIDFILTILFDMTERKQIEQKFLQAQKMEAIGTLTGGIAHEFNNILGIIIGNTEIALEDIPNRNPEYRNLEEIKTASLRAKDIIRQLLRFARDKDKTSSPVQPGSVVRESCKLLRASIPSSIEIRHHIPSKVDTILVDPTQLDQIIINLGTNAAHAMEDGGILEVSLENIELNKNDIAIDSKLQPGSYAKLTIGDTGCGIEPKHVARIFDPFFTTKEVGRGTGMGLAVVNGIVKSHGGAIKVKSIPDKGTTFEIFLPATGEESVAAEIKIDENLPSGTERILLVDDEESLVKIVQQRLERLGYKVETRTNPVEALELFRSNPDQFDLVITDMAMPLMTGDKFVQEILKICPDMPTILCTGYSEKMNEERLSELGVRGFMMKPIDKRELAVAVRKALDSARNKATMPFGYCMDGMGVFLPDEAEQKAIRYIDELEKQEIHLSQICRFLEAMEFIIEEKENDIENSGAKELIRMAKRGELDRERTIGYINQKKGGM